MKKKVIRVTIKLVGDEFADGSNMLIAEKMRTSVVVRFGGGAVMPQADMVIYGLSLPNMHKLLRIRWADMTSMMNTVKIEAGNQGEDLREVFSGNITFAYVDTANAPEIGLRMTAIAGVLQAYQNAGPIAWQGEKSVVAGIRELTERMGFTFENNGVPDDLVMTDVTLNGTEMNKIRELCRSYEIDLYTPHKTIAIAPQGAPRNIQIPLITPKTGMIGYPTPTVQGVDVRCLWSPAIHFGGLIRIADSLMETTNGDWRAFGVTAHLESETPGGNWFLDIQAAYREANNVAISRA